MKNPLGNAERWIRQAEYDLEQARRLLDEGVYSYAAFFAGQSAQKSLKAFLIARGARFVPIHSVGELAKEAAALEARFAPLIDSGRRLDRHYLISRYPDALPAPTIPAEAYVREDAEEAVAAAMTVFETANGLIGQRDSNGTNGS